MKYTYQVTGMTCNGCRIGVEKKLSGIAGVTKVSVDLEKAEAEIEMKNHISTAAFQNALGQQYTIREKPEDGIEQQSAASAWRQLFPLFLIFGYIGVASVLMNSNPFDFHGFMLDFMGLFFIVFSFFKMLDLKGFSKAFRMYDPLAKRLPVYANVYPFLETVLGLMFLLRSGVEIAVVATIVTLGITTVGVTKVLRDKQSVQCACLGTALKLPMTKATFIENSVMIVMSVIMGLSFL